MMDEKLLFEMLNAPGVSGNEKVIRDLIYKEIKKHVDEIRIDKMGNLIARKKGKKPRVMLAAHLDEIGLIIKKITSKGHIYISPLGGIEPLNLLGQRVQIETKSKKSAVYGIITTKDLQESIEIEELPLMDEIYVDTGLTKKELEKLGARVGSYAVPIQTATHLGSKNIISGKALDDRLGCYILVDLIKRLKKTKNDIYFVFTVQEEVGLYGAKTSAFQIEPDWGIAVDVTSARDNEKDSSNMIGKGPCVTVKDADMVANRGINDWLSKIAKKKKIKLQWEVSDAGTTDAMRISVSRGGVPSTVVGPAIRNIHSSVEIAHLKDIEDTINLIADLLKNPPDSGIV